MAPRINVKIILSGIFGLAGLVLILYSSMLTMAVGAGQLDPASAANAILMAGFGLVMIIAAFLMCMKGPRF